MDRMFPKDSPKHGLLPLHVSIENENMTMAKVLFGAGADPDGVMRDGITPLNYCISRRDDPEMARMLIQEGANIHKTSENLTPIEKATSCDRQLSLKVLQEATRDEETSFGGRSSDSISHAQTEEVVRASQDLESDSSEGSQR